MKSESDVVMAEQVREEAPLPASEPSAAPVTQTDVLLAIAQAMQRIQAQPVQPTGGPEIADALANMAETLSAMQDKATEAQANLLIRAMPENPQAPGISAYSHPEGELANPKAALKCEMFWVGFPLTTDTLTPGEIDVLNQLVPGNYRVTKGNGDRIPFTIEGKTRIDGSLESLNVSFPCKGDQLHDHRSMTAYCREALGERVPNVEDLLAEVQRLRSLVAA